MRKRFTASTLFAGAVSNGAAVDFVSDEFHHYLGLFWNGHEAQFSYFAKGNRHLTWIHLTFLFFVTLLLFSTRLLAEYITYRSALLIYWGYPANGRDALRELVLCALRRLVERNAWRLSIRRYGGGSFLRRRFHALGAALCAINTWASITAIIAVQLNYAIAPSFRALRRRG